MQTPYGSTRSWILVALTLGLWLPACGGDSDDVVETGTFTLQFQHESEDTELLQG